MLPRILEPEWMDDPVEAEAYDNMDHSRVNRQFVADLLDGGVIGEDILDLGTGTAQIPVLLCESAPDIRIMALDAAVSMLELARYNLELASVTEQIQLMQGDAKCLDDFEDEMFDSVISNSLIHHVPEPLIVFCESHRLVNPGGRVFLRDLMRPDTEPEVARLVGLYAGDEDDTAQQLFRQSLHAALTLDEVRDLVRQAGMNPDDALATTDRHWTLDTRKKG